MEKAVKREGGRGLVFGIGEGKGAGLIVSVEVAGGEEVELAVDEARSNIVLLERKLFSKFDIIFVGKVKDVDDGVRGTGVASKIVVKGRANDDELVIEKEEVFGEGGVGHGKGLADGGGGRLTDVGDDDLTVSVIVGD